MAHTPGPWTVVKDECARCKSEGNAEFDVDGPPGGYHGQFSNKDDAHLIAAAPELLAALIAAEEVMSKNIYPKPDVGPEHPWSVLQSVRDAIARAENRS